MDTVKSLNKPIVMGVCLFLCIATIAVYWQTREFEFIDFDDYLYIVENYRIHSGINQKNVIWAFKAGYAANWHPLTWLSNLLDIQLYGLNPGPHHLTNLLIHIVNTILLFLTLRQMSGALWQSAFVAALFALHPLHVESVAQVASRKDVLSTFFWLLTMRAYAWYVRQPGRLTYMVVFSCFVLGLMAKPMLVTLPFVLLLLDYWPLGRFQAVGMGVCKKDFFNLVWEKIPLFILTVLSSAVTFFVQQKGGTVSSLEVYPFGIRVANALVSYVRYIAKTLWPVKLAAFYPHPGMWPWWQVAGAVLVLAPITLLVIRNWRRKPYFVVGWFWYLGTLVPVIGLVQVGSQAMADRYTYVPLTGLFIMVVWGGTDLIRKWQSKKVVLAAAGVVMMSSLMVATWVQVGYWRNSFTLFKHAIEVTENNFMAHLNLGVALEKQGREREALGHYTEVLRLDPDNVDALNNTGAVLSKQGKTSESILYFDKALKINAHDAKVHFNLGKFYSEQGNLVAAEHHYLKVIYLRPWFIKAYNNLGNVLAGQGRIEEAVRFYSEGLEIEPNNTIIKNNLKEILADRKKRDMTLGSHLNELKDNPQDYKLHCEIANIYKGKKEWADAIHHYEKALAIKPNFFEAARNLGLVYAMKGKYRKARSTFEKAIASRPGDWNPYYSIAATYARQNNINEAVKWLEKSFSKGFNDWDRLKTDRNMANIRKSFYYRKLVKGR